VVDYGVLHRDDVAGIGVDAIAPENLAGTHIEQLHRHSQMVLRAQEAARQDCVDV